MPVEKKLLEVLACPKCKSELIVDDTEDSINCIACNLAYPVKDGIPILLPEKAIGIKKHQ